MIQRGRFPKDVPVLEGSTLVEVDPAEDKGLPEVVFELPAGDHTMASILGRHPEPLGKKGWTLSKPKQQAFSHSITATHQGLGKRVIVYRSIPSS